MRPVRVGIVGTNFVSDWMAEAVAQSGEFSLAAIYSRSAERGRAFAQKHGAPLWFDSYEEFLRCAEIDAVYIASPNVAHYAQALEALEAGKHVLCEKTMALNLAQAKAMEQSAKEKGLVLLEAIRPLYDPFLSAVKENLARIGRIRRASFEFCQYSSRYGRFLAGEHVNIFDASLGNAALLDLGVYCVHCCAALFGAPERIWAASTYLSNGAEAAGTALLDYGHMQATITYAKVTESVFPSVIQGEQGSITFDTLNQPSRVELRLRGGQIEEVPYPRTGNNMAFELAAFARCIRAEEEPARYLAQSMTALGILDGIRKELGLSFGELERL